MVRVRVGVRVRVVSNKIVYCTSACMLGLQGV